jgi:sugar lactone lactonase YvrE
MGGNMTLRSFAFKTFSLLVIIGMLFSNTAVAFAQQPDPATPTPAAPAQSPADPATPTLTAPVQAPADPAAPTETPPPHPKAPVKPGTQAATTFSISGKLTGKDGLPLAGVLVADDHGNSATTAADGTYGLPALPPGAYLVAPKLEGQVFLPYYRAVRLVDKDASGMDFYVPKTDPAVVKAPTNQPAGSPAYQPHPPTANETHPVVSSALEDGGVSSQALYTVGGAGLVFRYAGQFGLNEQPYPVDADDAITHLNTPVGVALDHNGNLLVAEEKGSQVVRFTAVDDSTYSTFAIGKAGVRYTDDNVFYRLLGTAEQPGTFTIWAADNSRVAEYDPDDGHLIVEFPGKDNQPYITGSGNDRLNGARGIAFNDDGSLMFVSDTYNNRVQIFDFVDVEVNGDMIKTPHYLHTINGTEAGGGGSTFNNPWHLTYYDESLYVADLWNYRIQKCDTDALTCTTFELSGDAIDERGLDLPTSIAFDAANDPHYAYITDGRNQRVLRCDENGENCTHVAGTPGVLGSGDGQFFWPEDISVGPDGKVYVADKQNARIQIFNGASDSFDFLGQIGETRVPYVADTTDSDAGSHLNAPTGIARTADGFYVAEGMGGSLVKYDNDGNFVGRSGTPGVSGTGEFIWWSGEPEYTGSEIDQFSTLGIDGTLGVDSHGRIYVPDIADYRIVIYLPDLTVFDTIGDGLGNDSYHFNCPTGVTIRPDNGDIYVVDSCNQRIQIYDSQRKYKATLGKTEIWGSDSLHFNWPHGVAVDASGNVYVADQSNNRVQKCRLSGTTYTCMPFAGVTGVGGADFRYTNGPLGITIGSDGLIYIAEQYQNRVEVFDPSGAYRTTLGGNWGNGTGNLRNPVGVVVDGNTVYVADSANDRVVKYTRDVPGWSQLNVNGWGQQWNDRASGFVDYTPLGTGEEMLYTITEPTTDTAYSPQVWRMRADKSWEAVSAPRFGDKNNLSLVNMKAFQGGLFVSTWNNAGAQIWSCSQASLCDKSSDWKNESLRGLGLNSDSPGIIAMQEYNGKLYAGTFNWHPGAPDQPWTSDGAELWAFDGTSWNSLRHFSADVTGTITLPGIQSMTVFNDELVIGATSETVGHAELWTLNTMSDSPVWTPRKTDFGINNLYINSLHVYGANLYVGTNNTVDHAMLYRFSPDYTTIAEVVVPDGFGDLHNDNIRAMTSDATHIYALVANDATGLQIWWSTTGDRDVTPGSSWTKYLGDDGFGNSNNATVDLDSSVIFWKGRMVVGAWNTTNGGGVWATDPTYTISGKISGVGANVPVTLNPGGRTTLTLAGGVYSFDKIFPGKYTLTPTQHFYTFSPVIGAATVTTGDVTLNFSAKLGSIDLLSPSNGMVITSLLPLTFSWTPLHGATKYTLQISTEKLFKTPWQTVTQTGTTYTVSGMKPKTTYYWRVRQSAPTAASWSATWSFITPWPAAAPTLSGPATGTILKVDTFKTTFTWKAAAVTSGAPLVQKYHVQVSQKTTFDSLDLDEYTLDAGLSYTTPDMYPNRFYYWRIQAVNTAGAFGAWSSVFSFKTLPGQVGLDWIENQDTLQPTFHWHDDWFTGKYNIQICKWVSLTTCSPLPTVPSMTNRFYTLTTSLAPTAGYRWRVQAVGTTGTGTWSNYWDWQAPNPPVVPQLISPMDKEIIPDVAHPDYFPSFSWVASAGANQYEFQAGSDSTFSNGIWMDMWTPDPSLDMAKMNWRFNSNTFSYWRVRACGDSGCSLWSTPWKLIAKPEQPINLDQYSDEGTLSYWFEWEDPGQDYASNYTIQICTAESCSSPSITGTSTHPYFNALLSSNTDYWWRVRGNGTASGTWSEISDTQGSFSTPLTPKAPSLSKPASGATTDYYPDFYWTNPGGATGYQLQFSRDSAFRWFDDTDHDNIFTEVPFFKWSDEENNVSAFWGDTFYWRVRAQIDHAWGPWSTARKFLTPAQIEGPVVDIHDEPVPDVKVTISGETGSFTTDEDGWFDDWSVAPGTHTITLRGTGIITQTQTVNAANGKTVWADLVQIPQEVKGTYRIVLSWPNPDPERELNAHLWLPTGNKYHISYQNAGTLTGFPYAQQTYELWGQVKVIDIGKLNDGKYVFAANQTWPTSSSWAGTGVKVDVWNGSTSVKSCTSPSGTGAWWYVFDMTVTHGVPSISCKSAIKTTSPAPYPDNTISGRITQDNGRPMVDGVWIDYGTGAGNFGSPYTISGIGSGNITITPSKDGWTFEPPSWTKPVGSTNVNFIAHPTDDIVVGGAPLALAVQGDYVYLGNAGSLEAVNVADKEAAVEQGKLWIAENDIQDIATAGDYAYVAQDDNGLSVVNIANPGTPTFTRLAEGKVGTAPNTYWTDGSAAEGVAVSGQTVYLAAENHFFTVNVTNPTAPAIVSGRSGDYGFARKVAAVGGKYAYVVGYYGLWVYNVTNPANPTGPTNYNGGSEMIDIAAHGNHVYVTCFDYDYENDFYTYYMIIYNTDDPAHPYEQNRIDLPDWGSGVSVFNNTLYVAAGASGLLIYDLGDDPSKPSPLGTYSADGSYIDDVVALDNYAYVIVNQTTMDLINTTDRTDPFSTYSYSPEP